VVRIDNRELYRNILDNLYDGVYFVDLHRKILFWNEAAKKITGYMAKDVVGTSCFDIILVHVDECGNNLCRGVCPLVTTMKTGDSLDVKLFLHHKDGHRVPVMVKTIPVKNEKTAEIEGGIEIFKTFDSISVIEKKINELENLAWKDELCKIPNRRYLNEKLEMFVEMYKKFDMSFGMLFLDIDHFKRVNDTYSHEVGDKVLKMVSKTISHNLRSNDIVARWGGEEFVICLNGIKYEEFKASADRIRILVENSFIMVDDKKLNVTVSIGGTLVKKEDDVASILKRADELLYNSKNTGRNRVTFG
jgi:diguanylate cyclase (GGDEF)-like protein/PAS domain S-box-containing protein